MNKKSTESEFNEDNNNDDVYLFCWRSLPKWVKLLTIAIAMPAFIIQGVLIFTNKASSSLSTMCIFALTFVTFVQSIFIVKAFWNSRL
jgi:hypothetical protein